VAVGLKLKVAPFDKLFPEKEKSGLVELRKGAQNLLNKINVGLAHGFDRSCILILYF
jgi:hypothetical protein